MLPLKSQQDCLNLKLNKFLHMKWLPIIPAFLILTFSCSSEQEQKVQQQEEKKNIRIAKVLQDSISIPVKSVGTLSSKTQSNLSFLTGGIIDRIYVSEGTRVEKDELLAKLNMTEINSRVRQATLGLEKSRRDFRRVENLYRDTVATLEQYQDAKTALDVAKADYEIAFFNKKNSEIRAPANGKILKKLKESNEIVAPGHPVLVFASTEAEWVLTVNLSDRDIVRVKAGDSASVSFDAYPGEDFSAIVHEIANAANPLSGTYELELKLLDLPEQLVTGLIGKAKILPPPENFLILPHESLVEAIGNQGVVFKMENGHPVRTPVKIINITSAGIILNDGLNEGDTVITDGNVWIKDGDKVEIRK